MLRLPDNAPKVLWVTSAGGHLAEAVRWELEFGVNDDSLWVTPDTPQSRSLLRGRRTSALPYVGPRDVGGAVQAAKISALASRRERFDFCVSTGAAVALFALPLASMFGTTAIYLESLTRVSQSSLTGRLLSAAPSVARYTPYAHLAARGWKYERSILDRFTSTNRTEVAVPTRAYVGLGTLRDYPFERAFQAVGAILPAGIAVDWQTGSPTTAQVSGTVHDVIDYRANISLMADADVVFVHAGVGLVLDALSIGKFPVLLVRDPAYGEHVDHHQRDLADELERRNLGVRLRLEDPDVETFLMAASRKVKAS